MCVCMYVLIHSFKPPPPAAESGLAGGRPGVQKPLKRPLRIVAQVRLNNSIDSNSNDGLNPLR